MSTTQAPQGDKNPPSSLKAPKRVKAAEEAETPPPPRERIVDSACELFRRFGIRGIGVDAIAEAAKTNKMTLYRQFGSKDDLVCEALKRVSEKDVLFWQEIEAAHPGDARAQLTGWIDNRARCLKREPSGCDLSNAAVELKDAGHPAHGLIDSFKRSQRDRLEALCVRAGARDAGLLADTLSMLLEGARVSRQATGTDGPSERFKSACEAAIRSFSAG
ncbi:TetR/AcrR family transcriptional regulator [Ensifer soli]|uniref:TetR/AcrR family transcriptional regulator n=1 Tax=Ciceribacter sp. sgz301302 TaxID=3342379 RepID=UPI0035B77848